MIRLLAVGALLTLCACVGSVGERVHEEFHQAIQSGATPDVHVDNVAGTVAIEGWSKPVVDVSATKYGYDASEVRDIAIGVRREGGTVFVSTTYSGSTHSGGVRYRLLVPSGAAVQVGNVAGSVRLAGITGNANIETQAGTIDARLGRVDGDRSIDLHATTGAITLWIAADSDATLEADSTVGAFSSDVSGIEQGRQNLVGARASGKLGSGTARIRLSTTTGAISLRTMR